jgi:(R,R)-butanediol dehydrogenase/meso-butanediol dehydrogenase/diacetyl reductase
LQNQWWHKLDDLIISTARSQRAIYLHGPHDLSAVERPVEEPAHGLVRVRVAYAGICGSDLHVFETGAYVPRFPVTPGHEVSGIVEAVGPGIDDLKPGDAVVLDSRVPCHDCDWCSTGELQRCRRLGFLGEVCHGGFAETVIAPATALYSVLSGLSLRVAVLAEPCAVALHGVRRALLVSPHARSALVVGLGPLGALVGTILRQHGLDVVGVEANTRRRETLARAVEFPMFDPAADTSQSAYDLVVDTAGFAGSLAACLERLRAGGIVLALALHRAFETIPANGLVEGEAILVGSHVFRDEMDDALALLAAHEGSFARLITGEVPLDGVADAYAALLSGRSDHLKVLVRPGTA